MRLFGRALAAQETYRARVLYALQRDLAFAYVRAKLTIKKKYRRNRLGSIWVVMPYFLFVIGIVLFRHSSEQGSALHLILEIGIYYLVYRFFSDASTDASKILFANRGRLLNSSESYLTHVLYAFFINMIETYYRLMLYSIFLGFFWFNQDKSIVPSYLLFKVLFVVILLSNVLMTSIFTSLICLRFPDMAQVLQFIYRISIFFSPILLDINNIEEKTVLYNFAWLNPLTHFMLSFSSDYDIYAGRLIDSNLLAIFVITLINLIILTLVMNISKTSYKHWLMQK